jgi:LAO/AO transport system kinase
VLSGDARAVARVISLIESNDPARVELMRGIYPRTGRAYLIGVTGPPGVGKSTLVDRMISEIRSSSGFTSRPAARSDGTRVGVIAVDPTSPFTGGAVLGDRLRMQAHAGDDRIFIRSMATRGHLGGLARGTGDAALVLDAAGCDIVMIETVGVGQAEIDVVQTADVSIVVLMPETGDEAQTQKAGLMEIADIFVVNKADRDGADRMVAAIEASLALSGQEVDLWRPPILRTTATRGTGVPELMRTISAFRESKSSAVGVSAERARRRLREEHRLLELIGQRFKEHLEQHVLTHDEMRAIVDRIIARELDPYTAADDLLRRTLQLAGRPATTLSPST